MNVPERSLGVRGQVEGRPLDREVALWPHIWRPWQIGREQAREIPARADIITDKTNGGEASKDRFHIVLNHRLSLGNFFKRDLSALLSMRTTEQYLQIPLILHSETPLTSRFLSHHAQAQYPCPKHPHSRIGLFSSNSTTHHNTSFARSGCPLSS